MSALLNQYVQNYKKNYKYRYNRYTIIKTYNILFHYSLVYNQTTLIMKLVLRRKFLGDKYTIGDLFIDGKFFCNTIEDTVRELPAACPYTSKGQSCKCKGKIYAETAIPTGTYTVTMEHSPRFKRKLPLLHSVHHFIGILIHSGTTEVDSSGCIIIGKNTIKGKVTESRITSDKLNAILSKEKHITIEIINGK